MHNFSDKDIEALVLIAAKKFNKQDELASDENARQLAMDYFQKNAPKEKTAEGLANTALLGVMNVYSAGDVQPVVRYYWGNQTDVPDRSPFDGVSTLGEVNRLDYPFGDNLGVEARAVANYLNAGEFDTSFVEYLKEYGLDPNQQPQPEPKLK